MTRPQATHPGGRAHWALPALFAVLAGLFTFVTGVAGASASGMPTSAVLIAKQICQKVSCTLPPGESAGGGAAFFFDGGAGELTVAADHSAAESLLAKLYSPNDGYYYLIGSRMCSRSRGAS